MNEVEPSEVESVIRQLDRKVFLLIKIYGVTAVREALERAVPSSAGRNEIDDLRFFRNIFQQDARDWLDGRKLRTSRSLAKAFAAKYPGHSELSTFDRVYRKLLQNRERRYLSQAWRIAAREYTPQKLIHALENIYRVNSTPIFLQAIEWVRQDVEDFQRHIPYYDTNPLYSVIEEKLRKSRPRDSSYFSFVMRLDDSLYEYAENKLDFIM